MSLTLVKKTTTDEYSFSGDYSDAVAFDAASPGKSTLESNPVEMELLADNIYAASVRITPVEITGIDQKVSLDGVNWFDELTPGAVDDAAAGVIGEINAYGIQVRKSIHLKLIYEGGKLFGTGIRKMGLRVRADAYDALLGLEFGIL